MQKELIDQGRTLSQDFIAFNTASPSPYHVAAEVSRRLNAAGFIELRETETWEGQITAGGKYYITRGGSSVIAWTCGAKFNPATSYFKIIGTHTDSPCVRLAPTSKLETYEYHMGYIQTYGGGLWHTWLDRDLIVAGRVLVKGADGKLSHRLYKSDGAIAKIADLCIHLRKDRTNITINPETQLRVIWATSTVDTAIGGEPSGKDLNHYRLFWQDVANKVQCKVEDILDFDLCFADACPAYLVGINQELVSAARIDNQFSAWASTLAIAKVDPAQDAHIEIAAMFDHEEIGSQTITGADSQLLPSIMQRIFESLHRAPSTDNALFACFQRSFFISADMAHAIHPSFSDLHQVAHQVKMNKGVVLKINCNNRYTTNGISGAVVKYLCESSNIPLQPFIVKQDGPCGSTIGPMLSSLIGVKAIDVGMAQLGMHSIRETAGVLDAYYYTKFFELFYSKALPDITMSN